MGTSSARRGAMIAILIGGATLSGCSDGDDAVGGPIPKRFQGAYNSVACRGGGIDGLVTIGADSVSYGSGVFVAKTLVAETSTSITLQGRPATVAGAEEARTFTMTYADVGGTAQLDGAAYERCSQY